MNRPAKRRALTMNRRRVSVRVAAGTKRGATPPSEKKCIASMAGESPQLGRIPRLSPRSFTVGMRLGVAQVHTTFSRAALA